MFKQGYIIDFTETLSYLSSCTGAEEPNRLYQPLNKAGDSREGYLRIGETPNLKSGTGSAIAPKQVGWKPSPRNPISLEGSNSDVLWDRGHVRWPSEGDAYLKAQLLVANPSDEELQTRTVSSLEPVKREKLLSVCGLQVLASPLMWSARKSTKQEQQSFTWSSAGIKEESYKA